MSVAGIMGVHVVGGGDLGVVPRDQEGLAEAVRAAVAASDDELLGLLGASRRSGPHRRSPLLTLLSAEPRRYRPGRLLLIGTAQDPPSPADTGALALRIAALLSRTSPRDLEAALGRAVTASALVLEAVSADAARRSVRDHLESLGDGGPAQLVLGPGGATHLVLGTLLGGIEAGVPSAVCEPDDARSSPRVVPLTVHSHEPLWLARLGLFDELAVRADAASGPTASDASDWRLLVALARLDHESIRAAVPTASETARLHVAVPSDTPSATTRGRTDDEAPPDEAPSVGAPPDGDEPGERWRWRRQLLQAPLARRALLGDGDALRLAWPWLEGRAAELALADGGDAGLTAEAGALAAARAAALDRGEDGFDRRLAQTGSRRLRELLADDAAMLLEELGLRPDRPAPHRLGAAARRALRLLMRRAPDDTPVNAVLDGLGHPRLPLLPGEGSVVVVGVGPRAGPQRLVEALARDLPALGRPLGGCHLRLVATPESAEAGERVALEAAAAGFATVRTVRDAAVGDYELTRVAVHRVTTPAAAAAAEILALPGTAGKAISLGVALGCVQAGFDTLRPVTVGTLDEDRADGGARVTAAPDEPDGRILARLAHDRTIGALAPALLRRVELVALVSVLELASPGWDVARAQVDELAILVLGDADALASLDRGSWGEAELPGHGAPGPATPDTLWPARARLLMHAVDHDPWRAIVLLTDTARQGYGSAAAGLDGMADLFAWREAGPLGSAPRPIAAPSPQEIRTAAQRAVAALRGAGMIDGSQPYDALERRWLRLLGGLEHIAENLPEG